MDAGTRSFRAAREQFFARHGARWPGTLADAYDLLALHELPRSEIASVRLAASGLYAVYSRAASLLRRLPDEALRDMGIVPAMVRHIRCDTTGPAPTVIGRFDFARTAEGWKLLELNADVPGLLVEAFCVNDALCREAGKPDPNEGGEAMLAGALVAAIRAALAGTRVADPQQANVVASAWGRSRRDSGIAAYLLALIGSSGLACARFVPIEQLAIDEDGLYDDRGDRVDLLLRVFPLQDLEHRPSWRCARPGAGGAEARTREHRSDALHVLLRERRLAVVNPAFAALLESKVVQVVIWNLYERGEYFDEAERELIERYMLPTYLDPPAGSAPYVVKPAFGSGGDSVAIVSPGAGIVHRSECTTFAGQTMVYQHYVQLPAIEVATELGPRVLNTITSCFVVSGVPAAVCMRAGGPITDESAWVLPVCVAPDRSAAP